MKKNIKKLKNKCVHEITNYPFCNKCCCIYDPLKNISSINKRFTPLIEEINFGKIYNNMIKISKREREKFKKIPIPNIKNRKEMIEKIFRVITIYKFSLSTFYLAIFLMDEILYLNNTKINKKYFLSNEEISLGSLFLAIKSFELEKNFSLNLSKINSFYNSSINYSSERLKIIEVLCLKKLNYKIFRITPYDYLNLFIKIGLIFTNEISETSNINIVYLNSNISKLSYEILDNLIKSSNEYFIIEPYLIYLGIIIYSKEKIMHCNNLDMFIYGYNISEKEIINSKTFIKENCARKKNELLNNNKEDLVKKINNKSQSPMKEKYYKLQKSFLLRPISLSSVNSRRSSIKKSINIASNLSTSSDEVNQNKTIKISKKDFLKENFLNYSFSYSVQNTLNSKKKKNIIKIRPLSQITENRKSSVLHNNKRLVNLSEIKSNFSHKMKSHKLNIKEMLKESERKKNNYTSIELSYLISHSSNKNKVLNNKKKNINIKPYKFCNKNIDNKQKEKLNDKKNKNNNIIRNSIYHYKKINNRTHSLSTSVSREKKNDLNSVSLPKKNIINYCKFVNQKSKIL